MTSRGPPSAKVSYTYGLTGNNDTLTYPSGRVVTYAYDDAQQLTSLQTANAGNIGFGYDTRGLASTVTLPSGVSETRSYDAVGQLNSKDIKNGTASIYQKKQTYTSTGNISQQTVTNPYSGSSTPKLEDFVYDPMSLVTTHKNNADGSTINGYSYNNNGNLTKINSDLQSFDDSGKILGAGSKNFGYDARNNRIILNDTTNVANNQSYVWGVDDRLTSVTKKVSGTDKVFGYTYSASGLLEQKTVAGAETNKFVWDESASLPLMLSDGVYEYIYGIDRVPVAQIKISDGTVTYLHTDINGSVIASTNSSGVVDGTVDYSPYGKPTSSPISKFGYAGDWTDSDTGYTYLRNRWLDTTTGTFLSEDPLTQTTGNSFGYTNGNPLTQIDPMGLCNVWAGDLGNIGSECYGFMDSKGFLGFANAAAGAGDSVLMGAGPVAREALGAGDVIDTCSPDYTSGAQNASYAMMFIPGGGPIKGANLATKASKLAKSNKNPVYEAFEKAGPGKMTMKEAKEKFDPKDFQDYITQPGAFANDKARMAVPDYLKKGSTSVRTEDRKNFNEMGDLFGCHHCGSTVRGFNNWVLDHMDPTAIMKDGKLQFFHPQCKGCFIYQGNAVKAVKGR